MLLPSTFSNRKLIMIIIIAWCGLYYGPDNPFTNSTARAFVQPLSRKCRLSGDHHVLSHQRRCRKGRFSVIRVNNESTIRHQFHSKRLKSNGSDKIPPETALRANNNNESAVAKSINNNDNSRSAIAVLLTVPMAWGTFEPAVRLVYQYQPNIPPFLFSFAYYLAAATVLNFLSYISKKDDGHNNANHQHDQDDDNVLGESSSPPSSSSSFLPGGIELGTYLFVGNALQVIGLKTVPSDKAAFLLQLTTIFVPLVQCLLARNFKIVPIKTWIACGVALLGVALIGLDGSHDSNSANSMTWNFGTGDFYIILGALFYTFHCLRLELYAKTTSAVRLAAAKASTETAWSGLVLLVCLIAAFSPSLYPLEDKPILNLARTSGDDLLTYVGNAVSESAAASSDPQHWPEVALATLWTGLVTVAYTIYAQSFGQARVPATTANLIYTIQPFFTALIAFLVLGETLGTYGYVGGTLIGAAVLLVVVEND
jgi:drug/metabolite transporter (DMT)-like permease